MDKKIMIHGVTKEMRYKLKLWALDEGIAMNDLIKRELSKAINDRMQPENKDGK